LGVWPEKPSTWAIGEVDARTWISALVFAATCSSGACGAGPSFPGAALPTSTVAPLQAVTENRNPRTRMVRMGPLSWQDVVRPFALRGWPPPFRFMIGAAVFSEAAPDQGFDASEMARRGVRLAESARSNLGLVGPPETRQRIDGDDLAL